MVCKSGVIFVYKNPEETGESPEYGLVAPVVIYSHRPVCLKSTPNSPDSGNGCWSVCTDKFKIEVRFKG